MAADAQGRPVRLLPTVGTTADCIQALPLLDGIAAEHLLADRGYDSDAIVAASVARGINSVIPPRRNRKEPLDNDKE